MKKKLIGLLLLIASAGMLVPFFSDDPKPEDARPVVTVTTFPLYEAVRHVAGESVEVVKVIPFGADIHTYRPSPKAVAAISRSVLFVYSGAGLEPWCEQTVRSLPDPEAVVDMSRHVKLLAWNKEPGHEAEHDHGHDEHAHGVYDPHYWLDVDNMIAMVREVHLRLSTRFPAMADRFEANEKHYIEELTLLKRLYDRVLADCAKHYLVSNHDAFGYLGHKYGFETVAVTGLSPDEQPGAKAMAELTELIRREGIRTVFFEAFASEMVSKTLARETGAKIDALQPLANLGADEAAAGENYITLMQRNLDKIANALECR